LDGKKKKRLPAVPKESGQKQPAEPENHVWKKEAGGWKSDRLPVVVQKAMAKAPTIQT